MDGAGELMHFYALVAIPPGHNGDVAEAVEQLMAPWREDESDDDSGFWDWFQIGGRWTGHLADYDPHTDPDNIETCDLCRGSGVRPDMVVANGCNGCGGLGSRIKWPTGWKPCLGDVQRWGDVRGLVLDGDREPYTALVGEAVAHRERYVDDDSAQYGYRCEDTSAEVTALLESLSEDARVVIVDYHS